MKTSTTQPAATHARKMTGEVVRRSGDKTIAVRIQRITVHPMYHKRSLRSKTYLVHDPKNEARVGDTVTIREHRPLSARKRWILVSSK